MIDSKNWIIKRENSKSTRKLYKCICDKCGADRGFKRLNKDGKGMCRSCVSSHLHKGKSVSAETKLKMSKSHFLKNGGTHPLKGKSHSVETIAKLSKATTEQNKKYQGSVPYIGKSGEIGMRSGWEVKYAYWLDDNDIKWEYEPTFELSDGRWYTPDFKLEDGTIVEIKGYFREDAKIKWRMFKEEYPNLKKSLLMKKELKDLGVL